ncbi:MAG: tyrosine-type recombinase/integrase [Chloroflexota bacterium]
MRRQVDGFLDYLTKEKQYSGNTLAAYRNDLNQFAAFGEALKSAGVTGKLLLEYVYDMKKKDYSQATLARKIAAIKSFLRFLFQQGLVSDDLAKSLISPRVPKSSPEVISPAEFQLLLATLSNSPSPEAKRDKAMLCMLHATGLRVSEIVGLDVDDVDTGAGQVRCRRRGVMVAMALGEAAEPVKDYLASSRIQFLRSEDEEALFVNRRGKRLTRQGFWQIIRSCGKQAGLDTRISPCALRHTFAVQQLDNGVSQRELQRLLGYAYVSSTAIYREHAGKNG